MLLAAAAIVSFVLVGGVVGARLLALARRTRALPEALLGAGLSSLVYVTLPAVTIGFALRLGPVWLQKTLFVVGLIATTAFTYSLFAFTARVFRQHSRAALALTWIATAITGIGVAGTIVSRLAHWEADRILSPQWAMMLLGSFVLGLGWSALESLIYYLQLRRQRKLGLGDAVVCNRFLLWACGGLGAVGGVALVAISLSIGWRMVDHPVPILATAFAGFSLAICWGLAFLPPRAYLRWVTSRAAA